MQPKDRPDGLLLDDDRHLRPVRAPLGHDRPEEEVQVATEKEAGGPEVGVLLDHDHHLRPVGAPLGHDQPEE